MKEKDLPLVQELDAKVKELHQNIAGLNSHQMSLRASLRKLKEKTADMDKEVMSFCNYYAYVWILKLNNCTWWYNIVGLISKAISGH